MIIDPRKAIKLGWIKNVDEKCIQPNGIDIRLKKLFLVGGDSELILGEMTRELPAWKELRPDSGGFFYLKKLTPYQFEAYEYVCLPRGVAMRLYMRSTLNRSGVFIGAGWWDSGFENYIGASFYPFAPARIKKGARIAQVVFFKANKSSKIYRGIYHIEHMKNKE